MNAKTWMLGHIRFRETGRGGHHGAGDQGCNRAGASGPGSLLITAPAKADDYPTGNRDSMWSDPATYMIGSFRHMGEIYPSRPVHRAGPVSALPPGTALAPPAYDA